MATPASKKSVMDVEKPGKTPAGATSRPVIVSHTPIMKDPMVTSEPSREEQAETTPAPEPQTSLPSHKVIQPLAAANKEAPASPDEVHAKEHATAATKADNGDEASSQDGLSGSSRASVSDDAVVDAVIEQVGNKKQQDKQNTEDEKRQELVAKLVADKTYFVPINVAQHRRTNRTAAVLVLALIPLLIGIVLAIDAGIITTTFTLPFDIIKN